MSRRLPHNHPIEEEPICLLLVSRKGRDVPVDEVLYPWGQMCARIKEADYQEASPKRHLPTGLFGSLWIVGFRRGDFS